jgi:hypothetical protein
MTMVWNFLLNSGSYCIHMVYKIGLPQSRILKLMQWLNACTKFLGNLLRVFELEHETLDMDCPFDGILANVAFVL